MVREARHLPHSLDARLTTGTLAFHGAQGCGTFAHGWSGGSSDDGDGHTSPEECLNETHPLQPGS